MLIPAEAYKQIITSVPILCADFIIIYDNKYLLVKRSYPPLQDCFWLPGGRMLLGESLRDSASRILSRELSMRIHEETEIVLAGITNMIYDSSSLGYHVYHTPAIILQIQLYELPCITLDPTSSEFLWSPNLPPLFVTHFLASNSYV